MSKGKSQGKICERKRNLAIPIKPAVKFKKSSNSVQEKYINMPYDNTIESQEAASKGLIP